MNDPIRELIVESPLLLATCGASLRLNGLSRGWSLRAGRNDQDTGNLRVIDLFENSSQQFVTDRISEALENRATFFGLPADIMCGETHEHGLLALWAIETNPDRPRIAVLAFTTQPSLPEHNAVSVCSESERIKELIAENMTLRRQRMLLVQQVDQIYLPIVGESNSINRIREQIETVVQTSAHVLICGAPGSGKETVARAIHNSGGSTSGPFVKLNCSAVEPHRLDELLFSNGVSKPVADSAEQGTLFLKEIAEVPFETQAKLFDAISSGRIPRVIASSTTDLQNEVDQGRFREDLFFRLSVFQINVPLLSERVEDVLPLTRYFVESICSEQGRKPVTVTSQQIKQLENLAWPGNVLELKSLLTRAVLVSSGNHLRLDLVLLSEVVNSDISFRTETEFQQLERQNILSALEYASWRISGPGGAAELLGIKPSTLAYRIKRLKIQRN